MGKSSGSGTQGSSSLPAGYVVWLGTVWPGALGLGDVGLGVARQG